jgi:hypothetical protein
LRARIGYSAFTRVSAIAVIWASNRGEAKRVNTTAAAAGCWQGLADDDLASLIEAANPEDAEVSAYSGR